jgi:hypothetical protein
MKDALGAPMSGWQWRADAKFNIADLTKELAFAESRHRP